MKEKSYSSNENGLTKMRSMIQDPKVVMMATNLVKIPFSVCPMTIQQMDDDGHLWFFVAKDSDHFKDIERDNRIQLLYCDANQNRYISIFGNATHIVDENKVEELWEPNLNKWFQGKDDPNLVLLNVNMENAYYWEPKNNSLVSFFPNIESTQRIKNIETGRKGHIDLQSY